MDYLFSTDGSGWFSFNHFYRDNIGLYSFKGYDQLYYQSNDSLLPKKIVEDLNLL